MSLNTLDIILLAVLLVTLILGLIKGLVRQIIGIVAVVGGLVLGAMFYPQAAFVFHKIISSETVSNFVGFLAIFLAVLLAGWLIGLLISKLMKGPLAFINHVMGGVLGLFKGVLICGVIVFAMLVFEVRKEALAGSRIAPLCFHVTKAMVQLIPQELKSKFTRTYREMRQGGGEHGKEI
jgi:membrane protein required for colicin V production